MKFRIRFAERADEQMDALQKDKSKKGILKQINKVLGYMETNLKHPSLNTHKFDDIPSPFGGDVFKHMPKIKHLELIEFFGHMDPINKRLPLLLLHLIPRPIL